jgi:hypothetical protein
LRATGCSLVRDLLHDLGQDGGRLGLYAQSLGQLLHRRADRLAGRLRLVHPRRPLLEHHGNLGQVGLDLLVLLGHLRELGNLLLQLRCLLLGLPEGCPLLLEGGQGHGALTAWPVVRLGFDVLLVIRRQLCVLTRDGRGFRGSCFEVFSH